jgi:hypothetical protein
VVLSRGIALGFFIVAVLFVYRSFYGMRIGTIESAKTRALDSAAD